MHNYFKWPFSQVDTDELAVFRSQWREELGLESSAGENDTENDEHGNDTENDGHRNDSNYSTPHGRSEQSSPVKEPSDAEEDIKKEVCSRRYVVV